MRQKGLRDSLTSSPMRLCTQTRCLLQHGTLEMCTHISKIRPTGFMNPIGRFSLKLMLCFVFTLLPYPHKAGRFQRFAIIQAR